MGFGFRLSVWVGGGDFDWDGEFREGLGDEDNKYVDCPEL